MDTLLSMFLKKETAPNLIRFDNQSETISHSDEAEEQMEGVEVPDGETEDTTNSETFEKKNMELGRGRLLCMDGGGKNNSLCIFFSIVSTI